MISAGAIVISSSVMPFDFRKSTIFERIVKCHQIVSDFFVGQRPDHPVGFDLFFRKSFDGNDAFAVLEMYDAAPQHPSRYDQADRQQGAFDQVTFCLFHNSSF